MDFSEDMKMQLQQHRGPQSSQAVFFMPFINWWTAINRDSFCLLSSWGPGHIFVCSTLTQNNKQKLFSDIAQLSHYHYLTGVTQNKCREYEHQTFGIVPHFQSPNDHLSQLECDPRWFWHQCQWDRQAHSHKHAPSWLSSHALTSSQYNKRNKAQQMLRIINGVLHNTQNWIMTNRYHWDAH